MNNKPQHEHEFEKALYLALKKHNWLLPVTDEQVNEFNSSNDADVQSLPPSFSHEICSVHASEKTDIESFSDYEQDLYKLKVAADRKDNHSEDLTPPESLG